MNLERNSSTQLTGTRAPQCQTNRKYAVMSEVKQLLKQAKQELSTGYFEDAIDLCQQVLKLDAKNYFAHIFLGKSYSSLENKDLTKALDHYIAASKIDPENMLAWKGLFLLIMNSENNTDSQDIIPGILSFDQLFQLADSYMNILLTNQQPQVDLIHFIRVLKKKNEDNIHFLLPFYQHYIPGGSPYETLGKHIMKPLDVMLNLVKLTKMTESNNVSEIVSQERLKLSTNDPQYQQKINLLAWKIYKTSNLDNYYNQLINLMDDDRERSNWENEWLEYKIKILKSKPVDEKAEYFETLRDTIDGMVLVDHDSLLAWKYFFDWKDWEDIDSIDPNLIMKFFQKFPKEPLAIILYLWLNSSLSSYDSQQIIGEFNKGNKDKKDLPIQEEIVHQNADEQDEEDDAELNEMLENDESESQSLFSEEEILVSLMDNINKLKNSTVAYRIISQYYILNKEYEIALPYIKSGISLVSLNVRDFGSILPHTKSELTLALATGYTYVDAPRNHKFAISLFDKILQDDETNIHAKLGKAIISIERKNWNDANLLLTDVIEEAPTNLEVMSQLAWTRAHLNQFDFAINMLVKVADMTVGLDIRTVQFRSETLWREAKAYLMKYDFETETENSKNSQGMEDVKTSFKLLIRIIKLNPEGFAKSYSTLGDIYALYYNDHTRAFKCYYKSFDLDYTDIVAARYITEFYSDNGNWEAAAQISERLVKAESSKAELRLVNWPYRVIGISYLEKQQENESIEWFQSAIRVDSKDVESWVGLGQAYVACGRIEASIKVFEKAIELNPEHLYARYFHSLSLSEMGEYPKAIENLNDITDFDPQEQVFQVSLASLLVRYAFDLFEQGYLTKSIHVAVEAIDTIKYILTDLKHSSQPVWISLSKALHLFVLVESQLDNLPVDMLVDIFQSIESNPVEEIDACDKIDLDSLLSSENQDNIHIAVCFLILASKMSLASVDLDSLPATLRSSVWCNIGISELIGYITLKDPNLRNAAVLSFKNSIKYQSNTVEAWIGLGMATMDINYRVAQHSFIKALSYAPKEVGIWFNLALLGLKNNDIGFANEVMLRTQSLAPQTSSPWLGMALILEKKGAVRESSNLFAHSFNLSNGKSRMTQLLYAKSVLMSRVGSGNDERDLEVLEEMNAVAAGLDQYFKKRPNDSVALEYALLVLERLHDYKMADLLAQRLTTIFEERFEQTQNEEELFNYGVIKAQLARIQLGFGQYEKCLENADLSVGILGDFDPDRTKYARISNHICLGLTNFFLDNFDETLVHFQELLDISKNSDSLVLLVSKVLYDVGSEDTRAIALQELTEYVTENGFNLMVTLTIAVISILENNSDNLKTILEELQTISLQGLIEDKHKEVSKLMNEINYRLNKKLEVKIQANSQRTAFFFPNNSASWDGIDPKIKQRVMCDGQNKVSAEELSDAYCSQGNLRNIQRSAFLCPWNVNAINSLRGCFYS